MAKFIKPYRMGDVVTLVGRKDPSEHIINSVMLRGEEYRYSTNRSAWFQHADFKLVRKCDAASIAKLASDLRVEEEGEEEGDDYLPTVREVLALSKKEKRLLAKLYNKQTRTWDDEPDEVSSEHFEDLEDLLDFDSEALNAAWAQLNA